MRIMRPIEILATLEQLDAGDEVRVTYEIEGDWVVSFCKYGTSRRGMHTTLATFWLRSNRSMTLGVNEIVNLERKPAS